MGERSFAAKAEQLAHNKEAAYQEFEKFARTIMRSPHRSPQRYALNDWFGLLMADSQVATLQSAIDAAKAFEGDKDLALPDDLTEAKGILTEARKFVTVRAARYRSNLIKNRQSSGVQRSPYEVTILRLNDVLYPQLFRAEHALLLSHGGGAIFTEYEMSARAMRNVVEEIPRSIQRVMKK